MKKSMIRYNARILVVEDDEFVRNISTRLLKELGCSVLEAANAAEGISVLENDNDIDLVFSDMMMPGGMNGVEMVEKMRESNPEIKAIIVSGYGEERNEYSLAQKAVYQGKPG